MNLTRFLYPQLSAKDFFYLVGALISGTLVAGFYGVSIFAGLIGFAATWWMGIIISLLLFRVYFLAYKHPPTIKRLTISFVIVIAVSGLSAICGWIWGLWRAITRYDTFQIQWMEQINVKDTEAFMTVGYIHNASYIGGGIGCLIALIYLLKMK